MSGIKKPRRCCLWLIYFSYIVCVNYSSHLKKRFETFIPHEVVPFQTYFLVFYAGGGNILIFLVFISLKLCQNWLVFCFEGGKLLHLFAWFHQRSATIGFIRVRQIHYSRLSSFTPTKSFKLDFSPRLGCSEWYYKDG